MHAIGTKFSSKVYEVWKLNEIETSKEKRQKTQHKQGF